MSDRHCSNCRAEIPRDADVCPACGVFAGEVFDGVMPAERRRRRRLAVLFVFAAMAIALFWLIPRDRVGPLFERALTRDTSAPAPPAPEVRVVRDRPGETVVGEGAAINEAEAIRLLRREIVVTRGLKDDCLAVMGRGYDRGSYEMTVFNHCDQTKLGQWLVDGKSGAARPAGK